MRSGLSSQTGYKIYKLPTVVCMQSAKSQQQQRMRFSVSLLTHKFNVCVSHSAISPHTHIHRHTHRGTHAYMTNQNKLSNIKTTTHASFTLRGISYEFRENNI